MLSCDSCHRKAVPPRVEAEEQAIAFEEQQKRRRTKQGDLMQEAEPSFWDGRSSSCCLSDIYNHFGMGVINSDVSTVHFMSIFLVALQLCRTFVGQHLLKVGVGRNSMQTGIVVRRFGAF